MIADVEDLEEMDASELHTRRLNAKEVLTPMGGEKFVFPIADGTVKLSGGDQVLRTSIPIQDRPDRGEQAKQWRSRKLSETVAGTGTNNVGSDTRTHTIQTICRQRTDEMDCPTRSVAHSSFPR